MPRGKPFSGPKMCANGWHEMVGDNIMRDGRKGNKRRCRACYTAADRARRAREKAAKAKRLTPCIECGTLFKRTSNANTLCGSKKCRSAHEMKRREGEFAADCGTLEEALAVEPDKVTRQLAEWWIALAGRL